MATVIVSGALANKPFNGGAAWTRLNWLLGFKQLGYDVFFLEQIDGRRCVDETGAAAPFEQSANLAFFQQVITQFGLSGAAALVCDGGALVHGLSLAELRDRAEASDLLINISGHLTLPTVLDRVRRKVYIDVDPGYTQFWHASGYAGLHLAGHDAYFTIGENIGTPVCTIPTADIPWQPTRQPVVLSQWPVTDEGERQRFTTVASWRGPYGPVQYGGKTYGLKVHGFRAFVELPRQAAQTFEIALDIHPADGKDSELLQRHGWHLANPREVAPDPGHFRRYVQTSGAEFSVAQGVYVDTASGWFSDRTVRYLASGKPALVQDTGFGRQLPVGEGLLAFRTLAEAVAGAEAIARDYERHARAARAIAETYFDSDRVLGALADAVGLAG